MIRDIVLIDEEKCDGCGLCVPACHEGAIQIINGKAKVLADNLCDGMGACLGHCPRGAIVIEKREAPDFDEVAVKQHLGALTKQRLATFGKQAVAAVHQAKFGAGASEHSGCPGSRMQTFARAPHSELGPQGRAESNPQPQASGEAEARPSAAAGRALPGSNTPPPSELTHWPVQLRLLPPNAPILRGASLLIAADCVPVAYPDFHKQMLRGRAVLIGCPKFDDLQAYVEKLQVIFSANDLSEVLVARMEVPCCSGILAAVLEARRRSGVATPVRDVVVGVQGEIRLDREVPVEQSASSAT